MIAQSSRNCGPLLTSILYRLVEREVEVSDVHNLDWGRFVFLSDPDGNRWAVQELPQR
jgi:hypothetical protein